MLALNWRLGLALTVIWLTIAFGFKISSLAALVTATLLPLGTFYLFGNAPVSWAMLLIAALIFWYLNQPHVRTAFGATQASVASA